MVTGGLRILVYRLLFNRGLLTVYWLPSISMVSFIFVARSSLADCLTALRSILLAVHKVFLNVSIHLSRRQIKERMSPLRLSLNIPSLTNLLFLSMRRKIGLEKRTKNHFTKEKLTSSK